MTFAKILLLLTTIITFTSIVSAQAPAAQPAAPAKVGLINSEKFSDPAGGVTRLVTGIRTVDAEFSARRDDIAQLVARFNTLQQVPPNTPPAQVATRREQAETLQIEIQRKQEDARTAYAKRMGVVTNPVRISILNALEAFAKQRGIDVLLDISKFPDGVLLVNPGAELTAAFVKDFNSKNP